MIFSPRNILFLLMLATLISCGDKISSKPSYKNKSDTYVPAGPVVLKGDVNAKQWFEFSADGDALITKPAPAGVYKYSLSGAPSWLDVDVDTGELYGYPLDNKLYNSVQITATDSVGGQAYHRTFSLAVAGDPLRYQAWHLRNSGQKAFSATQGIPYIDIRVEDVYQTHNVFGSGVKVAISDSGAELNHDDLYQNVIKGASKDYTRDEDDWKGTPTPSSAHGTAVSGLIAARGWNNIGSMGVAPKAKIAVFQFLESPQSTDILIDQASGDFDIFNYSYGDALTYDTVSNGDYIDYLRTRVLNGRNGKGPIYLKAAGNEFILADNYSSPTVCGSHNANAPLENEVPWLMVIGAVNADGAKASYSNAGSNIWVSGPGGEYGDTEPALITTDLPTCFKGYSKASSGTVNDFEYGHSLNKKCNYTSVMNGTSGATPVVAGVVALMLEANPDLTWRDVKHILAMTAKNDLDNSSLDYKHPSNDYAKCPSLNLTGHTYEHGWVVNTAGVKFHNHFGFGLVDAGKAVALAKDFNYLGCGNGNDACDALNWLPLPNFIEVNPDFLNANFANGTSFNIPDNDKDGVTSNIVIGPGVVDFVETVQIKVNITHPRSGQIGLELTSPSGTGTKSIMLNVNNSFLLDGDQNLNMVLASHAFYGEDPVGTWTLRVIDGRSGSTGKLNSWKINIIGHNRSLN